MCILSDKHNIILISHSPRCSKSWPSSCVFTLTCSTKASRNYYNVYGICKQARCNWKAMQSCRLTTCYATSYNIPNILSFQASFNITDEVDGSAIMYTITYIEASNNICASQIISPSSCSNGVCLHFFDLSASGCFQSSSLMVSVSASNLLGRGPLSSPTLKFGGCNYV